MAAGNRRSRKTGLDAASILQHESALEALRKVASGLPQSLQRLPEARAEFRFREEAADTPSVLKVLHRKRSALAEAKESSPSFDSRVRPQRILVDAGMPEGVSSIWRPRPMAFCAQSARPLPTRATARVLRLPDVTVMSGARAREYRWTKGCGKSGEAEYALTMVLEGRRRLEHQGSEFEGGAESAIFASSGDNGLAQFEEGGRYLAIQVSAHRLQSRAANIDQRLMRPIASKRAPLRLLSAYAVNLTNCSHEIDGESAFAIATHLIDIFALLLGAKGDQRVLAETRGLRAVQTEVIREAIVAGAAVPGFSVECVADQLDESPRVVHRLLAEGGESFADLVTARRLDVVRQRLGNRKFDRIPVADLAFACGFTDIALFHRQFAARFEDAPADIRARPEATSQ